MQRKQLSAVFAHIASTAANLAVSVLTDESGAPEHKTFRTIAQVGDYATDRAREMASEGGVDFFDGIESPNLTAREQTLLWHALDAASHEFADPATAREYGTKPSELAAIARKLGLPKIETK